MSTEFEKLIKAKQAADKALSNAAADLLDELTSAKAEYRKHPTPENRERRDKAVAAIQRYRQVTRAGRPGVGGRPGGDAGSNAPTLDEQYETGARPNALNRKDG